MFWTNSFSKFEKNDTFTENYLNNLADWLELCHFYINFVISTLILLFLH